MKVVITWESWFILYNQQSVNLINQCGFTMNLLFDWQEDLNLSETRKVYPHFFDSSNLNSKLCD